jgi:integrase
VEIQKQATAIEEFASAAAVDAAPSTAYDERSLRKAAALLARWAWQSAGLPLDREVIFARQVIGRFASVGLTQYSEAGQGNIRSQLLRMGEALLGPRLAPVRLAPLGPAEPTAPYSLSEVTSLRSWALCQSTTARRANADVLLALGLGAGLSASEIGNVRVCDIAVDDEGVILNVTGTRSRSVPVLRAWERALIERTLTLRPDQWAFRENHTENYPNLISNFVARSGTSTVLPQSQRLRSTWLVGHLTNGTPVIPLMQAAGVESLEALTRYVRFVPVHDVPESRRVLSRSGSAGARSVT